MCEGGCVEKGEGRRRKEEEGGGGRKGGKRGGGEGVEGKEREEKKEENIHVEHVYNQMTDLSVEDYKTAWFHTTCTFG